MELSEDNIQTIQFAKRQVRYWKYLRLPIMLFGIGMVLLGFWLIVATDILMNPLAAYMLAFHFGIGAVLTSSTVSNWHDKQRQLLLKLSSLVDLNAV